MVASDWRLWRAHGAARRGRWPCWSGCLQQARVVRSDARRALDGPGDPRSCTVAYFLYLLFLAGLDLAERKRVLVVLALFVASALFWSGYEQAGSSMNLFAKRFTDRMVGSFEIPAGWFQSVQPALHPAVRTGVFGTVDAPRRAATWIRRRRSKFAFGLLLMGLGFLVMVGAADGRGQRPSRGPAMAAAHLPAAHLRRVVPEPGRALEFRHQARAAALRRPDDGRVVPRDLAWACSSPDSSPAASTRRTWHPCRDSTWR